MKTRNLTILAGLLTCSALSAQDAEVNDPPSLSPGERKVTEQLASEFEDFAGDNSRPLIEALRTGSDLSYEVEREIEVEVPAVDADGNPVYKVDVDGNQITDPDGNPIQDTTIEKQIVIDTKVVENTAGPMGFGNAKISMLLAEQMLSQQGLEGTMGNISGSLFGSDPDTADGILEMRAGGAGWGEISKELLDTNLGALMSAKNTEDRSKGSPERGSSPKEKTDADALPSVADARRARRGEASTPETRGKPERTARVEKPSRPDKPAKPEKPARPEKPSKPERPTRPERPEKPAKPDRPNR